ncbi:MAG: histidinol-phosphate aminotransferase family protein [Oligoflexus sp.]|nr:histidinol-phosphate aminotransferase family protein [Oligoflexus sp.]
MTFKHGGLNQLALKHPEDYLDLSVNINPYGPRKSLSLSSIELANYPDPHCQELREVLAKERGKSPSQFVIGNGATEILWACARAFLKPNDQAIVIKPSFGEFAAAVKQLGRDLIEYETRERDGFQIVQEELDAFLDNVKPRVLYLCNPNSPSGTFLEPDVIDCLAARHLDCLILLDESFLSLSQQHHKAEAQYRDNVIRIVSLTKDHAIAAIRLGYAMGATHLIEEIRAEIPVWSVNALAQKIGAQLFEDKSFLERSREFIFRDKATLEAELDLRKIHRLPSQTVFVMFKDETPQLAERLFEEHQILIRPCQSYGLDSWYRIAVRPRIDMQRFFSAYDQIKDSP